MPLQEIGRGFATDSELVPLRDFPHYYALPALITAAAADGAPATQPKGVYQPSLPVRNVILLNTGKKGGGNLLGNRES